MNEVVRTGMMDLLPGVYGLRDDDHGGPLRGVLDVIGRQVATAQCDIETLYDNSFIETSQPWSVPYIGELVGVAAPPTMPPEGESDQRRLIRQSLISPRRQVADAVNHFRRKGTLSVLEELANTVAGWPAHAVERVDTVAATSRPRDGLVGPSLLNTRSLRDVENVGTAFDRAASFIDFRKPETHSQKGQHHVKNVGLYVWRIPARSMTEVNGSCYGSIGSAPNKVWIYTFDPAGVTHPLLVNPVHEQSAHSTADASNVPGLLTIPLLSNPQNHREASAEYYGIDKSLAIWIPGFASARADDLVPAQHVRPADLRCFLKSNCGSEPTDIASAEEELIQKISDAKADVFVDPECGLMATADQQPEIRTTYHYGFSADLGGGEYRRPKVVKPLKEVWRRRLRWPQQNDIRKFLRQLDVVEPAWLKDVVIPEGFSIEVAELPKSGDLVIRGQRPANAIVHIEIDGKEFGTNGGNKTNTWEIQIPSNLMDRHANVYLTQSRQLKLRCAHLRVSHDCYALRRDRTVLEFADSNAYRLDSVLRILVDRNQSLEIVAVQRCRPTILTDKENCIAGLTVSVADGSEFRMDGMRISGGPLRIDRWQGGIDAVRNKQSCGTTHSETIPPVISIRHATIVSTAGCHCTGATLQFDLPACLTQIQASIIGGIEGDPGDGISQTRLLEPARLRLIDSLIDGDHNKAIDDVNLDLRLERCTVLGRVNVRSIDLAQDSIFTGMVSVARPQVGGMRFCAVDPRSMTPPLFYCEAIASKPFADPPETLRDFRFESTEPSSPAYGRLANDCAIELRQGAEDESEMGVFHDLFEPHREANLRRRVQEFTPASMQSEIHFANQQEATK